MDKQFLYSVIAVLTIASVLIFIQKKNPEFFPYLTREKIEESWRKDAFQKNESPKEEPPKEESVEQEPQPEPEKESKPEQEPEPKMRHHQRRHKQLNRCPPNTSQVW